MKLSQQLELIGIANTENTNPKELPLFLTTVTAGFPSPADDYVDKKINLHEYLIRNNAATFFLKAHGESMINAGIYDGDLLIVDRSIEAAHNKIVIAAIDGELTVKRLIRRKNQVVLAPENPDYPEFDITLKEHIHIWGVVTYAIHKVQ